MNETAFGIDMEVLSDGMLSVRVRTGSDYTPDFGSDIMVFHEWREFRDELEEYGYEAERIDRLFREIKLNPENQWREYK